MHACARKLSTLESGRTKAIAARNESASGIDMLGPVRGLSVEMDAPRDSTRCGPRRGKPSPQVKCANRLRESDLAGSGPPLSRVP